MTTVLKLPFLCYVVLCSVVFLAVAATSVVGGTFVLDLSQSVRLVLAVLGIGSIFLWRRPILFLMVVLAWWLPQLFNITTAYIDSANRVVREVPRYAAHLGPNLSLYFGYD